MDSISAPQPATAAVVEDPALQFRARPDGLDCLLARIADFQRRTSASDWHVSSTLFGKGSKLDKLRGGWAGIRVDVMRTAHRKLDDLEKKAAKGRPGWMPPAPTRGRRKAPGKRTAEVTENRSAV